MDKGALGVWRPDLSVGGILPIISLLSTINPMTWFEFDSSCGYIRISIIFPYLTGQKCKLIRRWVDKRKIPLIGLSLAYYIYLRLFAGCKEFSSDYIRLFDGAPFESMEVKWFWKPNGGLSVCSSLLKGTVFFKLALFHSAPPWSQMYWIDGATVKLTK